MTINRLSLHVTGSTENQHWCVAHGDCIKTFKGILTLCRHLNMELLSRENRGFDANVCCPIECSKPLQRFYKTFVSAHMLCWHMPGK